MEKELIRIRRALLTVSGKTGLAEVARGLREHGAELISTGKTAEHLRNAGLTVTDVAEVTGLPEMLDGRVKTLHPAIQGALLPARGQSPEVLHEFSQGGGVSLKTRLGLAQKARQLTSHYEGVIASY